MTDKSWKAFERRISKWFPGAHRRGAYTGDGRNGKPDLICPGWSVECKLMRRIGYQDFLDAAHQAERDKENAGDIPIAIVKRLGERDSDSLVVMRLETFGEHFINAIPQTDPEAH